MSLIISAILFSISSNLDNLVIGIAYGVKKIKINLLDNFVIAFITTLGTFLSMSVGLYITRFISKSMANRLGASILILLGTYFAVQSLRKFLKNKISTDLALKDINDMIEYAEKSDTDKSGDISTKEAFFVALGLTFNNLGTGIAASITGVNIALTLIATFAFSILSMIIGQALGSNYLGKMFGKYAPLASGILLIILGIIEFLN